MVFIEARRLILMHCWFRGTYRALVWAMLLASGQAQTPPSVPAATAPAAASVRSVYVATLPDATTALASSTRSASQSLHVLVGRSLFIKSVSRLKRVYVSNPVAVDSFTSSPTQIVITAKTPGVSSLILWDEAGQSASYLVFSDLDVASLQAAIRAALPDDNLTVEAQEDRVSLSGTVLSDASAEVAVKLAALYAKSVVNSLVVRLPHIRQVKLQVQIIEIDRSKVAQFGINLFSYGKNQSNVTTGQFPSTQTYTPPSGSAPATLTSSNPLNLLFYNFGLNIGLTLQDLQARNIAQILAEPTITTLSGQKASFLAGGEFPFPVVQGSSGGLTSITIQFRPYGVKLDFTPIVNDDGTVQLKVAPEVSALDYTNAVTISGYTIPAISTRRAETQVELRDGQSFAISGLLDHRTTDIFDKMPGIGDVPILGQLFRSKNVNHSTVELMVIVTPSIVDPLHDATSPTPPKLPVPMLDPKQFDKKTGKQKPATQPQPGTGGTE
jgi:pilus assembly protein CpaC